MVRSRSYDSKEHDGNYRLVRLAMVCREIRPELATVYGDVDYDFRVVMQWFSVNAGQWH